MDVIKSRLLELWIEINNSTLKDTAYMKYIESVFNEFFQLTHIHYYYVKKNSLVRLLNEENEDLYHAIPYEHNQGYLNVDEVCDQLLLKAQEFDPGINKSFIIRHGDAVGGVMFFKNAYLWEKFLKSEFVDEMRTLFYETALIARKQIEKDRENKLNEDLLQMAKVFHSTMNANEIVDEILRVLQKGFSNRYFNLVLSNDQEREYSSIVHTFDYENETEGTVKAFVSGEVTTELLPENNKEIMNIPIIGLQGTYGVIQLELFENQPLNSIAFRKIKFLGDTAGKALENAKLYDQSHRIVADLQLINESSHRLNMNLSKSEIFHYLSNLITESFEPSEVAIVFLIEEVELKEGTSEYFMQKKGCTYMKYIVEHFEGKSDPLFIADFQSYVKEEVEFHALMAVPIIVNEKTYGFALVMHKDAYYFSFESYKLMQSIIRHSSLAISNVLLREKMQILVDQDYLTKLFTRSYIEKYVEEALIENKSGVLILIDIDDFKKVNDQYGHQVGDKVLRTVGKILNEVTAGLGISARWGGEELACYFPNKTVDEISQTIVSLMEEITKNTIPSITVSIGLSFWNSKNKKSYLEVFKQADEALYSAKENGKNKSVIFGEDKVL